MRQIAVYDHSEVTQALVERLVIALNDIHTRGHDYDLTGTLYPSIGAVLQQLALLSRAGIRASVQLRFKDPALCQSRGYVSERAFTYQEGTCYQPADSMANYATENRHPQYDYGDFVRIAGGDKQQATDLFYRTIETVETLPETIWQAMQEEQQ